MRIAALITLVLLLSGCPPSPDDGKPGDAAGSGQPVVEQPIYFSEAQFYEELERLQELASSRPTVDGLYFGHMDDRFRLGSSLEWPQAGFTLKDAEGGGDWNLTFWNSEDQAGAGIEVMTDEFTGTGYRVEFRTGDLTVTASAQWVHGRFLLCRREVVLAGMDVQDVLPAGGEVWRLDGPWMPYRMLPGPAGPFSVVREDEVDGDWHRSGYPDGLAVPAIAAYDRIHGMLLCVADDHPRRLDRSYDVSYRLDPGRHTGALAAISYAEFDSTRDAFAQPPLASGLVRRDSVVLVPLDIPLARNEGQYVELPARFIIGELGKVVGAFHFSVMPEGRLEEGAVLVLDEWLGDSGMQDDFGRLADSFGAHHVLTYGEDLVYEEGWQDSPASGMPLLSDRMEFAEITSARVIAQLDPFNTGAGAFREDGGEPDDIRLPGVASGIISELGAKLNRFPNLHGVTFRPDCGEGETLAPGQTAISRDAACAELTLALVDETRKAREDARALLNGGLNLCMPPLADGYINSVQCRSGDGPDAVYSLNARFMNHVYAEVFQVAPFVDCGTSLAEQVLVTTPGIKGHFIHTELEGFDGFGPFALDQGELRRAGGDLLVLHSRPEQCSYSGAGDIPAEFTELVAVVPADWEYTSAVWIAFIGTGGSVALDNYNNLSIGWGDPVQYWERKLPPGLWSVDHPAPDDIQPGDAVVVLRKPISPPGGSISVS